MPATRRHVAPVMSAVLLLLLGGCDAFTPRVPPTPCDPADPDCRVCPYNQPLSPSVVRDNIVVALECFLVRPNYEESISAAAREGERAFVYVPNPALAALFPGFFDGWNEDREVQFMLDLLETGSERPTRVDFNVTRFVDTGVLSGDEARYDVEYDLTLTYVDSTEDPPVETTRKYCATALWDLIGGNNNLWRLQRWEEISASGDAECLGTMGLLRATTGQGL